MAHLLEVLEELRPVPAGIPERADRCTYQAGRTRERKKGAFMCEFESARRRSGAGGRHVPSYSTAAALVGGCDEA